MGNRLKQVSLKDASPEVRKIYREFFGDRDPVAQPGTATGTPGDYWTTYALVPDILQMSRDSLLTLLQPGRVLEPKYRELAILRAGIVGDCKFEYSQHMKVGRMVGLPEEKLNAIKGWATSDKFDAAERAVMAAADELVARNLIEDATFAALKSHFSDEQILELVFVIATWRMHGIIVRALHLEYDGDTTARMQEVPAPPAK
ncbi:MAG TPA: carboxymuconolactone decarboxylase family protein [Candidatus Binataceae bacterium]|nr:carboxymuconolactone decarboxylase family protein [Candidatus Binataceae bacterium]